MAENAQAELGMSHELVTATLKDILGKASKFRTQVIENKGHGDIPPSSEPGHRTAAELFLDGAVAAQTLGKDQLSDLLNIIEEREGDYDWVAGYKLKLGLTPQAIAEWQHQQAGKARVKGLVNKLNPFKDRGVDAVTGREK